MKRSYQCACGLLLGLVFFTLPAFSAPHDTKVIVLSSTTERHCIGPDVSYIEDKTGSLDFKTIRSESSLNKSSLPWKKNTSINPAFGFTRSVIWLRFTVKEKNPGDARWELILDYPHIDFIELYSPDASGGYSLRKAGDHYHFDNREVMYRNFVFNLSNLPEKENVYYLRIKTECSMNLPLWIMSSTELNKKISNEQILLGLYYGLMIVIAMYNLFIFLSIRDRSYLYYILWIIGYGMYQISMNGLAFQYFWPGNTWWTNISIPFFISAASAMGLVFGRSFLKTSVTVPLIDRIIRVFLVFTLICTVLSFFLPYAIITQIGTTSVLFVTSSLLVTGIICLKKGYRAARFYVLAWTSLLLGIMLFALKTFGVLPENLITNWGQQVGSAIEVTLLSFALADRINIINREKKTAREEQIQAQDRYRLLFDGSNNIIFTLDTSWKITSINRSIKTILGIDPTVAIGKFLPDLVYRGTDRTDLLKAFIINKLEGFALQRTPISFKMQFHVPLTGEPKELHVSIEYVTVGNKLEVFGKASLEREDLLMKYIKYEKQRFQVDNYLSTADDLSYRVTRNLLKYMDSQDIALVRMAISEIIINAIEHGNLNISFKEKTAALARGDYFEMIAERQKDPVFGSRTIDVLYSIDENKAIYQITDCGDGFDHRMFLNTDPEAANNDLMLHGRGLSITRDVFDEITFNEKGNQVTVIKRLNNTTDPTKGQS